MTPSTYVMGIDADTKRIAYAVLKDGLCIEVGTIMRRRYNGNFHEDYDKELDALFGDKLFKKNRVYIWLENVFKSRNVKVVAALGEVQGEVIAAARRNGQSIPVEQRPYQQAWRAPTIRTSKKEEVPAAEMMLAQSSLKGKSGKEFITLTEHEAAAVCIGVYGHMVQTGMVTPKLKLRKVSKAKTKIKGDL